MSRTSAKNTQTKVATADTVESKVVALAEQLGWFLGTVKGKADGLLANESVRQEVARIRDGAAELMEFVNRAGASAKQAAAGASRTARNAAGPQPVVAVPKPSRGAVDAPGKRHRKPPPQLKVDKRMGEPLGKKMGQKHFRPGKSAGRR